MKMHSNERPFACDLCPLTFKIRHHLDRHRKTVHRDILFGGGGGGKKLPEKVTEIAKIDEIVDKNAIESTKEAFKDLPVATESTLLQMISDQIPPEVIPLANSEPVQPQCCSGEFPLPAEMIQSYQDNYTTYPESYSIPQETYLPAPDYSINPQEILEIPPGLPPENMDTQLLDPSFIPQYPYNMWDNQFDCQNTMNQQAIPQNPQATYNIGSILSNLELMENNATFDPGYDFFESTPQQQFYGNGTSCPDTEILQWQQKIDQYDFNSQNHTLTDISNTFLREEQRQSSNLSSYVNNFGTGMGGEEQQVFNANNVNVMLPSLADYLQNHLNPFNTSHEDVEQQ
ncbi:uncharacterized protein LOC129794112 isoform X2 [Lutzomyia longipalpis]|uniref:uncharacterized protein LOC129794112 isoform X2 n=1 Tax=Lutzomyia longipalpis TaxID=7200 RepID=UPI00248462FF|nr:uncharacterized protein LOC129794112 isoform X2 [Lutzomyia longipalpis]